MSKLIAEFFLYFLPLNIFILMICSQASYHYLKYKKNHNEYIPKSNLLDLSTDELNKYGIYLDPTGKYFFDNKFIDLLVKGDLNLFNFLQNIRFMKQDMSIYTGSKNFSVAMLNTERLLKSSIQVGINNDNSPKLCYKPNVFQMLFQLESVGIADLLGLANRFACECNNFAIDSLDISKLSNNERIDYHNAYRAFIRESLNVLKPIKVSAKLSLGNFFNYAFMNNITMNCPEIESRSKIGSGWKIFFAIVSYFLLAVQATILGTWWESLISNIRK